MWPKPSSTKTQLRRPQSGFRSARHISPTTIGVSSMGRIRIARTMRRAAELLVEEERERRAEDDLDRDARERQDERVLDGAPELAARDEFAVVAEPDPRPGVGLRVVVLEGADEADDEREDRERDEVERPPGRAAAGPPPPLRRRDAGGPAACVRPGVGGPGHRGLSRRLLPEPASTLEDCRSTRRSPSCRPPQRSTEPFSAPANSCAATVIISNVSGHPGDLEDRRACEHGSGGRKVRKLLDECRVEVGRLPARIGLVLRASGRPPTPSS